MKDKKFEGQCKYCGHATSMEYDNLPQLKFAILNVCICPCHWGKEHDPSAYEMLRIAKELWEKPDEAQEAQASSVL